MHVAIVGAALSANGAIPMLGHQFADKSAPTKAGMLHRHVTGA